MGKKLGHSGPETAEDFRTHFGILFCSNWGPRSGHTISKILKQAPGRGSPNRVPFGTCSRAAGMRQVREGCQKSLVRGPWVGSQKRPILAPPLEEPAEYCRRCRSPEGVPFWSLILTQKYALGGSQNGTPQRARVSNNYRDALLRGGPKRESLPEPHLVG